MTVNPHAVTAWKHSAQQLAQQPSPPLPYTTEPTGEVFHILLCASIASAYEYIRNGPHKTRMHKTDKGIVLDKAERLETAVTPFDTSFPRGSRVLVHFVALEEWDAGMCEAAGRYMARTGVTVDFTRGGTGSVLMDFWGVR